MLAISSTYYDTLKFLHVLAAIVWLGSGVYAQFLATAVRREDDPARLATVARDIGRQGQRLITPAAISVLVFGVWLVAADPYLNFTDTWIEVGLLGYLLTSRSPARGSWGPSRRAWATERRSRSGGSGDPRGIRDLRVARIDLVVLTGRGGHGLAGRLDQARPLTPPRSPACPASRLPRTCAATESRPGMVRRFAHHAGDQHRSRPRTRAPGEPA